MRSLNGEILSKDRRIATVQDGIIIDADSYRIPLFLARTGDVTGWLAGRAIDSHRTNSRLLKKALRLTAADDAELVLKVNAVTITDTYWFREAGSTQAYDDVRFKKNMFDRLALSGDPDSFSQPYSPTPELTNTGSFEKCWRLENGRWWMLKRGNGLELFSELFICRLGQELGFPMADYQLEDSVIKSPDFTEGAAVNFEPAEGLVGDNEDYLLNLETFWNLSPELARQYLQIIYLDTLCFNMDRHTKNYGVLRDVETGEILRMAPNFDNNIALFARGIPKNLDRTNDKLVELFGELLEQDRRALKIVEQLPTPNSAMVERCISQLSVPEGAEVVCDFVLSGHKRIQECIQTLEQRPEIGRG